jgi:putative solute:sodium symporter small subunit
MIPGMPPISALSRTSPPQASHLPQRLGGLRIGLLTLWATASFGTCYFARDLPFGAASRGLAYELAGQGVLIVFIVLVIANAVVFNRRCTMEDAADDAANAGG